MVAYKTGQAVFGRQHTKTIQEVIDKYQFGYSEYNRFKSLHIWRAIDLFERAYRVGRLDELVEKG